MRTPVPLVTALLAALLILAGCGTGGATSSAAPVPRGPVSALPRSSTSHVVVMVLENKGFTSIVGSRQARYFNSLIRRGALLTNYHGVRHPSLPNYLALISGSTLGVTSDCSSCHRSATTIVDQFESAGISWKAYMESMPRPCFTGSESGNYARKHNPFVYIDEIRTNPARCAKIVPGTALASDLRAGTLPDFAWLTPNTCNDMHDCGVATGDRFLRRVVPPLAHELGPHGFLVITFDEGESDASCCGGLAWGGHPPTLLLGPDVRRGAKVSTPYSHYSTLRTIEEAFGLAPLGKAANPAATPLDAAFKAPPRLRRGR